MSGAGGGLKELIGSVLPRLLPFADAATAELPLGRLLRLSLFQISVGMAVVLLNGTLNRVMILELGIPTWLVASMVSLPLLFAPARALIGHRSDHHRSALGWRRVPYIWMGTMMQFGGLAIMPFALLVLSGDTVHDVPWAGEIGAALAFLTVGVGLHTTQTAGLALATDLAPEESRPRVVALLYVTLLIGMVGASTVFGYFLSDFSQLRLIKVIQGAGGVTMVLNIIALWRQEARRGSGEIEAKDDPSFLDAWRKLTSDRPTARLLVAVALGTAGFSMQDILLEPYGGEILKLSVGATTALTALTAGGTLVGFAFAARVLGKGGDPYLLAASGGAVGVLAFSAVIFADPLGSATLFRVGAAAIGLGGGLFSVGTLTAVMSLADRMDAGLALGAWGAVQATAAGVGVGLGGLLRDLVGRYASQGALGPAMTGPGAAYSFVYHLEVMLLFATLAAIGPLVRYAARRRAVGVTRFGLAQLPD
ncbi:MAG: BCD family MFS transporter [Myxococcales bacterium]|nr:BCD family MFS transporter [Myxococcales bacterium]